MHHALLQFLARSGLTTWHPHLLAVLACALTTALTLPLHDWLDPVNTVMLFLLTVVLIATRLGRGPAVLASFLSVALFDFFYVPPRWSFAVSNTQYLMTFAVMLTVALVIGHLANGLRERAQQSQAAARQSQALYALASQLGSALSVEQVQEATQAFVQDQWQAHLKLWLPDASERLGAQYGPLALIVQATYRDHAGAVAVHHSDDGDTHAVLHLAGSTRCRGVLVVSSPQPRDWAPQRPLLSALAALVAAALERLHFVDVAQRTQLEMNDERVRNAILSALSHDIRTPLTSLYGLADALTISQPPLPGPAQDMAQAMRDQAMRLHRMVSNLLDMAKLQSGKQTGDMRLRREWQPIEEVIGASIQLLGHGLAPQQVKVHLAPALPLVAIDAVLMERVFGNLLENASKYSPPGSNIDVHVATQGQVLLVRVCNGGAGFPPDKLKDVFQVFERGQTESSIPGVGLGLAIAQAIVEAHEGHIEALNPDSGGAEVRFTLPLGTPPTIEPEAPADVPEVRP
jgi:two-component system sensor histidine kinase KdpD